MFKLFICCLISFTLIGCSSIPSIKNGQSLNEFLTDASFSGSVLVVRDGKIVHRNGYGFANSEQKTPNTPDTQYLIGSVTKQFTALAIMQLQEQELLNIEDTVDTYLPDFPNGSKIKIKHLLTHSSGIYNFTDQWDEISYSNLPLDELLLTFRDKSLIFEPGSKVSYSNSGYVVAGLIIETLSGKSYSEYIHENIFEPLGMNDSGYGLSEKFTANTAIGYRKEHALDLANLTDTYAAGAIRATINDLYLWGSSFDSDPLVNKDSLSAIFPTDRSGIGLGFGTGRFKVVMGFGWFFYETELGPEYSHGGHIEGFSSVIARYPEDNSLIIILSNKDQYDIWTLKNRVAELVLENKT
jgi:CubicO group peptidase (beta-lactamase class C family)